MPSPDLYHETIHALMRWFESLHVSGMIIGGVAVSILGNARTTEDVDAVAGRPGDMIDMDAVANAHPELDWDYVYEWAEQFSAVLDASRIIDSIRMVRRRCEEE